jgi:hypothetical protein
MGAAMGAAAGSVWQNYRPAVECSGYFGFNCKINKKYLLDKRKFDDIIYLCVVKLYCFTRGQCGRSRPETTGTSHTDPKQGYGGAVCPNGARMPAGLRGSSILGDGEAPDGMRRHWLCSMAPGQR